MIVTPRIAWPALLLAACGTLVVATGLHRGPGHAAAPAGEDTMPLHLAALPSPAGPGSALPQLHASARGTILSWVEREGSRAMLKFAERVPSGWSPARLVAAGDDWFVNWADVPSVVRLANGALAAHFLQKSGPGTYAYDVRLTWSADEGRTWAAPFSPHGDGTETEHGFASLFDAPGGGLGVVWLDGRATASTAGGHGHGQGAMALRFAAYDRGWRQTADALIDGRVCDCCPTSIAITTEGPIVGYRDRSDGEVRDISVSRLVGFEWTAPVPLHADGWEIHACPVNGPALAAAGPRVAAAWFTVENDTPQAWAAFSVDGGRSFGTPVRLDDRGTLGRVGIALLPDGSAIASYIEHVDGRAEVRVRRIASSGERGAPISVAAIDGGRASGYPRVAYAGNELLIAWTGTREGETIVRTAVATVN